MFYSTNPKSIFIFLLFFVFLFLAGDQQNHPGHEEPSPAEHSVKPSAGAHSVIKGGGSECQTICRGTLSHLGGDQTVKPSAGAHSVI